MVTPPEVESQGTVLLHRVTRGSLVIPGCWCFLGGKEDLAALSETPLSLESVEEAFGWYVPVTTLGTVMSDLQIVGRGERAVGVSPQKANSSAGYCGSVQICSPSHPAPRFFVLSLIHYSEGSALGGSKFTLVQFLSSSSVD